MANTILHKRSSTPAAAPTTGDIALGEIAINTNDGKLYIKKDDGAASIVEIGAAELSFNDQTGTSYVLVLGDSSLVVTMNNAAANTVTVPPNSSVAYPIGTQILVEQRGAGQTTMVAGAGVTLNSAGGLLALTTQYSMLTLIKVATDTWTVAGDLA